MHVKAILCVLWTVLVCSVCSQSTTSCDSGWFGSNCQYKCRCASINCNRDYGCTSGTCTGGWFGPACQYADLAYNKAAIPIITDGNDTTCRNYGNAVTVNLTDVYAFTWLRISVNNSDVLQNLTVQFNDTIDCVNQRNATVDNSTLDIYCDQNAVIKSVTLSGEAVPYLCSVYISGGRNVALKQNTTQSSTYFEQSPYTKNQNRSYPSSKAVDGDTSGDFYGVDSCSCTYPSKTAATWSVIFPQPLSVRRYVIYNRVGDSRLKGFTLQSFDTNNSTVFTYTDLPARVVTMYTIAHTNVTQPVLAVNITANIVNSDLIQLCEVEVYGEYVCDPKMYGRDCENKCTCAVSENCFISTGGCPSGCPAGFEGEACKTICTPETYGPKCSSSCSDFCTRNTSDNTSCDHVNGTCLQGCQSGYEGQLCTSLCKPGFYGPKCSSSCSDNCVSNATNERSCDHVNGTCLSGCKIGYQKPSCTSVCERGRYGQDCNFPCSTDCIDTNKTDENPCHYQTGICMFGCLAGHYNTSICPATTTSSGDINKEVIIGAVVGSIAGAIVVILIVVVVIVCMRRKRTPGSGHVPETEMNKYANVINGNSSAFSGAGINNSSVGNNGQQANNALGGEHETANANTRKYDNILSTRIYDNALSNQRSTIVSLNELDGFLASKDQDFYKDQFTAIPTNTTATMIVGMSAENKHKNRYKNICAYDHSRVHLIPNSEKKQGDYINASYIEGYNSDEKFIASQGPTMIILEDFVRMLWEQNVEKVVMLTNLVEDGKKKSERYWPEDDEMKIGEITVRLTTTQVFADYTIRRLQLKKQNRPGQDLIHFHFTSWPDKDVPNAPWGLVDFEQRVASYPTSRPIVVHCSAGVGRTGTFIALRNVMRQAEETGCMDFFTTVQKLRNDRLNMIQTPGQYIFLHRAAQVAMLCVETTIMSKDIQSRIETLKTKTKTGQTKMDKEFKSICSASDDKEEEWASEENPYTVYENSQNVVNRQKNRFSSILPKELYRTKLRCEITELGDYINAVLVPSFSKQNQQILTQLPLPGTVTDFWRLITQYKVNLIVAFEVDKKTTDQTIASYLPSSENINATSSMFKIKTEPVTTAIFWRQQKLVINIDLAVKNMFDVGSDGHQVTHLTCTSNALDKGAMIALIQHIRSLQLGDGRIMYMCRNGADYSGLVCVLSLLLDRMDNDQCLTVPLVVGAIKSVRPHVIPSLVQYQLLYEVLNIYSESMNEYSNFGSSNT